MATARRFLVEPAMPPQESRLALSQALVAGGDGRLWPLNGYREAPWADMNGWFIWVGDEFPTGEDAWEPLHVSHADRYLPHALQYLALPAGWRFLTAPNYEDVWLDQSLLENEQSGREL